MSNIAIIAKLPCKPGTRSDVAAGMQAMLDHVENNEPGTLRYIMLEDSADADVIWMFEEYTDQAALDAHSTSDAMKALIGAITPHMAGRPELTMTTVAGGKGA